MIQEGESDGKINRFMRILCMSRYIKRWGRIFAAPRVKFSIHSFSPPFHHPPTPDVSKQFNEAKDFYLTFQGCNEMKDWASVERDGIATLCIRRQARDREYSMP
jgi:hypothetical protein